MKRSVRVAILAAAVSAALAFAGSALAQFAPRLIIDQDVYRPGGSAGTTSIEVVGKKEENAIAKLTIYVPPSYTANISQAPGTTIGSVVASVQAKQIGENAILPITGSVVIADQSNSVLQMQAAACTGAARHAVVWVLALVAAGQQLNVPLFVDPAAPPENAFASYKIQLCLPSPDIPPAQGGAAFGAKILDALLDVDGVYTNPSASGRYPWRGVFTPYAAGTGTPNPAGTVESRGIVSIPSGLSLKASYVARTNTYRLQGKLTQVSPVVGASVQIFRGLTPKAVLTAVAANKPAATTRTNKSGAYSKTGKLKPRKRTYFLAIAPALAVENSGGCSQGPLPVRCVTATTNDVLSNVASVKPRR